MLVRQVRTDADSETLTSPKETDKPNVDNNPITFPSSLFALADIN